MGKTTGFLEYARRNDGMTAPEERIKSYNEFHLALGETERREQAARCMECGVPFCQSGCDFGVGVFGCPLHNLIPEWNDAVYDGNYTHALERLLKTNNFPEFTGRVCPALCEKACVCGIHGSAVTVHENELSIIENAWEKGLIRPRIPAQRSDKHIAVVGSGPAGLAAADQLNHRGHNVTVFERDDRAGGLLMYGIPNMKLDKSVVARRVALMQAEGVEFRTGVCVGKDVSAQEILDEFDCVILCCGAETPRALGLEGESAEGVSYALPYLKGATKALLDGEEPAITAKGKNVVIIGAGDTSSDCVATAIRQGCKSVTQLVRKSRDKVEVSAGLWGAREYTPDYAESEAIARFGSSPRRYETQAASLEVNASGALTAVKTNQGDTVPADLLLIASGFSGCGADVCTAFGLETDSRGNIATVAGSHATASERVFAAGDMRRGQSLVVWAIAEGREAAREADEYLMGYTSLR
jgi:glutamate synthase (NADPH/NADH) small chain